MVSSPSGFCRGVRCFPVWYRTKYLFGGRSHFSLCLGLGSYGPCYTFCVVYISDSVC